MCNDPPVGAVSDEVSWPSFRQDPLNRPGNRPGRTVGRAPGCRDVEARRDGQPVTRIDRIVAPMFSASRWGAPHPADALIHERGQASLAEGWHLPVSFRPDMSTQGATQTLRPDRVTVAGSPRWF
jgi:hypothetical protein